LAQYRINVSPAPAQPNPQPCVKRIDERDAESALLLVDTSLAASALVMILTHTTDAPFRPPSLSY